MRPSQDLDSDPLLETTELKSQQDIETVTLQKGRQLEKNGFAWLTFHLCAFLIYSSILIVALLRLPTMCPPNLSRIACAEPNVQAPSEDALFSPLQSAMHEELRTVYAAVDEDSPYKGPPTMSVDKAWRDLFRYSHIRIKAADLVRMNRTSIQLSDGSDDFLATPDTYHQLHCLWYIFQNVHPKSYTIHATNVPTIDHLDHCIDSLRQHIMCHATTSLQTYSWISDLRIPWANFNVDNMCVNWEAYDGWAKSHSIDVYDPNMLLHPDLGPSFPGGEPLETNYRGPG